VDVSGSELEGSMQSGQAFGVVPEWDHQIEYNDTTVKSDDHKIRLYSNASPKWGEYGNGECYSTTVKRVFDEHEETGTTFLGVDSNYMCDMDEGDTVKITGPTGRDFLLPDDNVLGQHNYVFLAAGTGIAPFRGMTQELIEQDVSNPIHLILGVPYQTDVLYDDWFREVEKEHDNFHFHEAISRQQKTDSGDKMYVQERILAERDPLEDLLDDESTLAYICGLKGMETGIYRAFLEMNCDGLLSTVPNTLKDEDFGQLSDRDERLSNVRPNEERVRVEVY
jgi:ferredoxin--NADP+ reductase